MNRKLGIRWTLGDVAPRGFEALRLSVWGAFRLFGAQADYVVVVNTIGLDEARRRTGALPHGVAWETAPRAVPPSLARHLGPDMAEGVGWKLLPLQRFPDRWELSLDNDVILWDLPAALAAWLEDAEGRCLIAEDVRVCLGQFADLLPPEPRNSGIRGLPPGFDLDAAMRAVLCERPVQLTSELDEQGLQVAAVSRVHPPLVVTTDEVSICSPFPPHQPDVGRAGAHFVGLNVRRLPFDFHGRPATDVRAEHWERWRPYLYERVGLALEGAGAPTPTEIA